MGFEGELRILTYLLLWWLGCHRLASGAGFPFHFV